MDLNAMMEFDHVIQVHADGSVTDAPKSVHAPESVYDDSLESVYLGDDWSLLTGYTGQYGYNGPTMHPSEFIGGGLARDILAQPGYYVALLSCADDTDDPEADDDNLAGWAVAFKESDES